MERTGREWYICKSNGDDENPGTKEQPRKLLWKLFDELKDGDIVRVAEGVEYGQGKLGTLPKITKSVTFEGGWSKGFTSRDPFKYLSIIKAGDEKVGNHSEVFQCEDRRLSVTIDGFCIDRGGGNIYFSEGELNEKKPGFKDCSPWGYRNINRKMSGSDPSIELIGETMVVRNCIIINSPWWGIYVKCGGAGNVIIENNLILGFQGRGIEAIVGGGWGAPNIIIRNNTVAFGLEMEGRAISLDPKAGTGKVVVENNVLAFNMQTGIMTKFDVKGDDLTVRNNLFFFNKMGDYGKGGSAGCNAGDLEDEVKFVVSKNQHKLPQFVAKVYGPWLDRYTLTHALDSKLAKESELRAARDAAGLGDWAPATFDKTFPTYGALPKGAANYDLSRYPHPFKEEEGLDEEGWKQFVLPILGQDGDRGVQLKFAE